MCLKRAKTKKRRKRRKNNKMDYENLALDLDEIKKKYPDNPLEFFKGKKICIFKACLETYFPGIRWGILDLLEELDLDVSTCDAQSCCSGTFFQRNLITRAQFVSINERNLNEINNQADILLVPCNGCYNSLLRGREFLNTAGIPEKSQKILDQLRETCGGDTYPHKYEILEEPKLRIVHDLDFLHLIQDELIRTLKFDLKGLKVAVHYGCHYLNLKRDKKTPESYLRDKTKLEDLVKLFGGNPVDYQERESCCGWGASQNVIHREESLQITYNKLKSAENVEACFLLMPCPTCLYNLSKPEFRDEIQELQGEELNIPTIHINELVSILRGCEEERCITYRRKSPRFNKIFEIITQE